jgi:putative ABC transport system substrate-binding protein
MPDAFTDVHRAPIILAAARNNVPAVYHLSTFARDGGLLSYGTDRVDSFRRAATYVDRILRGAKPAEALFNRREFDPRGCPNPSGGRSLAAATN